MLVNFIARKHLRLAISDKNRLEAFLRRAGKSGYYNDNSLATVAAAVTARHSQGPP